MMHAKPQTSSRLPSPALSRYNSSRALTLIASAADGLKHGEDVPSERGTGEAAEQMAVDLEARNDATGAALDGDA